MPPFGRSSTTSTWYSSAGHFPLSPLMQPPLPNCSESRSPRNQRHEPWSVDLERSEEHTSELQSLMRTSYAVFCLKKTNNTTRPQTQQPNDLITNPLVSL